MTAIVLRLFEDFMSIRKIPLKEHSYLTDGDPAPSQEPDERPTDPQVDVFMLQTRKVILNDRAIHDQVSSLHVLPIAGN
jgi:ATP-dependent RNA helicase DDX55/SPB4